MKHTYLFEIICALLILLFLYTALSKLNDFNRFSETLSRAPVIGKNAFVFARAIPSTELLVTVMLFFPRLKIAGLYASLLLLLLFTGYLIFIVVFKSGQLPCSCGGVLQSMSWKQHILFNSVCIMISLAGIRIHHRCRNMAAQRSALQR